MRLLIFFLLLSLGADAQIIRANAFYRPTAASTFLLDDYPNAAAAYSLRKLKSSYSGSAIRIRRDSTGNAETDIGFTANGDLDTAAIKTHCRNNSCAVTTWYDQSGNALNVTQITASLQPRIVTTGVINRINNLPSVLFDNSNDRLASVASSIFNNKANGFFFTVSQKNSISAGRIIQASTNSANATRANLDYNSDTTFLAGGRRLDAVASQSLGSISKYNLSQTYLFSAWFNWTNSDLELYIDGNLDNSTTSFLTSGNTSATNGIIFMGATTTPQVPLNGYISEVIIYNTDESSNRTGIETNINNYYGLW